MKQQDCKEIGKSKRCGKIFSYRKTDSDLKLYYLL